MKMLAGGGALPLALVWKGVAVDVGKERITTRTGRWSRRDSVKNLACMNEISAIALNMEVLYYLFTPRFGRFSLF